MDSFYYEFGGNVSIYTMDHRGTGRSFRLQCDAAEAMTSGSPGGSYVLPRELPSCIQDILFQIGTYPTVYNYTKIV